MKLVGREQSRQAKFTPAAVIPAKAGIQNEEVDANLDSRFRGNDKVGA